MSNNFLSGNPTLSKNSTDGLLNLLQLSLLGNNGSVNINTSSASVPIANLNARLVVVSCFLLMNKSKPTSQQKLMNKKFLFLNSASAANNLMGMKSANLYLQSAAGMTGIGMANMSNAINLPQQSILSQPIVKTGRPIVNTTNLAANNLQPHQVIMHSSSILNVERKINISLL